MDVAGLLTLTTFAGIDFDEEAFLKSKIIKNPFEDETFCECLQNLPSLLFRITVNKVHNSLFTFLKFGIIFCFVS
jgi:hypothetical protein